jgi:hypothetical protein
MADPTTQRPEHWWTDAIWGSLILAAGLWLAHHGLNWFLDWGRPADERPISDREWSPN